MRKEIISQVVGFLLLLPALAAAQPGHGFIFRARVIGPLDSGIVSVLEDQLDKETGMRKGKVRRALFFTDSREWKAA